MHVKYIRYVRYRVLKEHCTNIFIQNKYFHFGILKINKNVSFLEGSQGNILVNSMINFF